MSTEVWKCYTDLEFSYVTTLKEADLILSFAPRRHGYHNYFTKEYIHKGWDFDGPGGKRHIILMALEESISLLCDTPCCLPIL